MSAAVAATTEAFSAVLSPLVAAQSAQSARGQGDDRLVAVEAQLSESKATNERLSAALATERDGRIEAMKEAAVGRANSAALAAQMSLLLPMFATQLRLQVAAAKAADQRLNAILEQHAGERRDTAVRSAKPWRTEVPRSVS